MKHGGYALGLAGMFAGASLVGVLRAQPPAASSIHACMDASGTLRIAATPNQPCPAGQKAFDWNVVVTRKSRPTLSVFVFLQKILRRLLGFVSDDTDNHEPAWPDVVISLVQ